MLKGRRIRSIPTIQKGRGSADQGFHLVVFNDDTMFGPDGDAADRWVFDGGGKSGVRGSFIKVTPSPRPTPYFHTQIQQTATESNAIGRSIAECRMLAWDPQSESPVPSRALTRGSLLLPVWSLEGDGFMYAVREGSGAGGTTQPAPSVAELLDGGGSAGQSWTTKRAR